jgi:N-acetylneuraminate synthase
MPIDLVNPSRALIVAELTNNHLGNKDNLMEMVRLSKQSGADLIKVQKRDVDSFYTKDQLNSPYESPFGTTLGDYRRGVELNDELLDVLEQTCVENDIEWFCSVLDYPSYLAIKRFNPRLIKLPSTISNHRTYMRALAKEYAGTLVVSTGYTDKSYEDYILETFPQNQIYLLHCVSAYPTPPEHCNAAVVQHYAKNLSKHDIIPGYSSHDEGSLASQLAVAAGARMLEKHVKLDNSNWIHFDNVAVNLRKGDFAKYVADIRHAETILGSSEKQVLSCEHHKYGHDIR